MAKKLEEQIDEILEPTSLIGWEMCQDVDGLKSQLLSLIDKTVNEVIGTMDDLSTQEGVYKMLLRSEQRLRYQELRGKK